MVHHNAFRVHQKQYLGWANCRPNWLSHKLPHDTPCNTVKRKCVCRPQLRFRPHRRREVTRRTKKNKYKY
jgi:hypothetical protein